MSKSTLYVFGALVILAIITGHHETQAKRAVKKYTTTTTTTTTPAPYIEEDELIEEEPVTTPTPAPKRRTKPKKHSAKSALVIKAEAEEAEKAPVEIVKPVEAAPLHPVYHYQQHAQQVRPPLPLTHSQSNWKIKLFKEIESQLPQIERDALDMAKGFLYGFGWKLQGWEIPFMESIVGSASRDMLSIFQLLL